MSYWDVANMSRDADLQSREAACAAQENIEDAWAWAADKSLELAAQPGWSEAWSSAVASGVEFPGRDAGVITDGMILSAVQAVNSSP